MLLLFRKLLWLVEGYYLRKKVHDAGKHSRIGPGAIIYNGHKISVGRESSVGAFSYLNCRTTGNPGICLRIGDRCSIGRFSHINAYGSVTVENDVLMGERVHISDMTHHFADANVPVKDQPLDFVAPVVVKRGAWIGSGAVLLPGVTVGKNAVVGANSVVSHDVPDNQVAVGVPARTREKKCSYMEQSR